MKKIIETIDIKSNESLFRIASAMSEFQIMRKCNLDEGIKEPKSIKFAMDAIIDILTYKFQQVFIDEFPKYAKNKMSFGEDSEGLKVRVFDEHYDDCENSDDCNNESVGISDMLKESGLETSDDHVERLADDLKNKRGGLA